MCLTAFRYLTKFSSVGREKKCHILHLLLPVTEHCLSVLVLICQCDRIKSIQAVYGVSPNLLHN